MNATLQSLDRRREVFGGDLPRDVLAATDVPGVDLDDNRTLNARGIRRVDKTGKQRRIVVDDCGVRAAADLT